MKRENDSHFSVQFTEEFNKCLDEIQTFFMEQGEDVLKWWYSKEDNLIIEVEHLLSSFPYIGKVVEHGEFKGFRVLTYGKSRHRMLNYVIFYQVYEDDKVVDAINILPSRSKRKRIK